MKIIDIHIHGGLGVNFNTSNKEEIKKLLKELYDRGIVAICPTLVGDSTENLRKRFELFREIKDKQENNESRVIGLHLEGTFLNPDKPGIQDKNVFLTPTIDNFKKLTQDYEDIVKIVTLAPELDKNNELADYLESKNIRAHAGHTLSDNIGGASATTHHFNAMPQISHRGANLALDSLFDNDIYCEIIADEIHCSKNMLKLFFKTKKPEKIILVSDALPAAHAKDEIIFCGKKINSDGKDNKGTLAGSVLFLDEIIKKGISDNLISSQDANKYAFENPLKHLCLKEEEIGNLA